ncbi:MAG TPA: phosphoribosyl-AMP cyclohydrolase, partial [Micrococcales bacterium]|nr:phosphoribosyl-AMP cyclohydrolase [Micrococcales bacterium]
IAEAAGLSARGLQQSLRRHLDQTPGDLLRSVRLDGARQELLRADRDATGRPAPAWKDDPVTEQLDPGVAARLKRDADGLVAAIVQDDVSLQVLMLGWMDDEAVRRTLTTGRVTFWSRSRQEYWRKGDTSGHTQHVRSVALDCDGDALLVRVEQVG